MEYDDEDIFETGIPEDYRDENGDEQEREIELEEEEGEEEDTTYKPKLQAYQKRIKSPVHKTPDTLNKTELTALINTRAVDLSHDAPPVVSQDEIDSLESGNIYVVAQLEMRRAINALKMGDKNSPYVKVYLPIEIERELGNGIYEEWKLTDFRVFEDQSLPRYFRKRQY